MPNCLLICYSLIAKSLVTWKSIAAWQDGTSEEKVSLKAISSNRCYQSLTLLISEFSDKLSIKNENIPDLRWSDEYFSKPSFTSHYLLFRHQIFFVGDCNLTYFWSKIRLDCHQTSFVQLKRKKEITNTLKNKRHCSSLMTLQYLKGFVDGILIKIALSRAKSFIWIVSGRRSQKWYLILNVNDRAGFIFIAQWSQAEIFMQ